MTAVLRKLIVITEAFLMAGEQTNDRHSTQAMSGWLSMAATFQCR